VGCTSHQFDKVRGTLEPILVIPTIPTTFTGNNTGADPEPFQPLVGGLTS
jgi:hypothetical protein